MPLRGGYCVPGSFDVMHLKMSPVIELELWSRPSSSLPPEIGKLVVAARCSSALSLPAGVVLGLSEIPDPIDSQNLDTLLAAGELLRKEFDEFCKQNGLEANVGAVDSAAKFLEYSYGRPLAWVHLSASTGGVEMGQRVNAWAHSEGYCLVEPHGIFCFLKGASLEQLLLRDA